MPKLKPAKDYRSYPIDESDLMTIRHEAKRFCDIVLQPIISKVSQEGVDRIVLSIRDYIKFTRKVVEGNITEERLLCGLARLLLSLGFWITPYKSDDVWAISW